VKSHVALDPMFRTPLSRPFNPMIAQSSHHKGKLDISTPRVYKKGATRLKQIHSSVARNHLKAHWNLTCLSVGV